MLYVEEGYCEYSNLCNEREGNMYTIMRAVEIETFMLEKVLKYL